MAEGPLVRLHTHGYHIQRLVDTEYADACLDPADWASRRDALVLRWRKMVGEWAGLVETALAGDGTDLTTVSRFHNAPQSGLVQDGVDFEWAGIRAFLVARLDVLGKIIEGRRRAAGMPVINIGGSVGALNLGTILGDVRGSVTHLQESGQADLARLFSQLVEKLPSARLSAPEKDDAAQLTRTLAQEMAKQPGGKASAVAKALGTGLGTILSKSSELATIWRAIEPHLR